MDKINNNIPVISVITVCFNNKDGLEKTLKSFAAQNFSQKEIIVVDGGSHDGTEKTIQRYKNIIDHFICESDNGIYDAINKGIRRASGKWVVCMNAGDIFASDTVLSEILDRDIPGDKQFLYSDYAEIDGHGKITIKPSDRKKDSFSTNRLYTVARFMMNTDIIPSHVPIPCQISCFFLPYRRGCT